VNSVKARKWLAGGLSLALYVAVLCNLLVPAGSTARNAAWFGDRPLGLPATLFAVLVFTLAYSPFPWVLWHLARLLLQALHDARKLGVAAVFTVSYLRPEMRPSQLWCFVGAGYAFLLVMALDLYEAHLGL
jgi:hypothetical protein